MAGKLSSMFGAQDMTQGSPVGNLVKFSVPLLIGNLAQQLYSTVDSIVVGNYVGDGALAAVGASGPILNLLLVPTDNGFSSFHPPSENPGFSMQSLSR